MKKYSFFVMAALVSFSAKSQDIGQIIAGSKADANQYLNIYMEPFGKGEILNMGRGWVNTARVHKLLGFDLSVNVQAAIVPADKQSFVFRNADYSTFKLKNTAIATATLPTFMGDDSKQILAVSTTVNGKPVTYEFESPRGVSNSFKFVPLPIVQLGFGLIKHTDLKLRYFPKTKISDVEVGVFGVGVQHEFSDYLPFIKKVPFLHLSALAAYNTTTTSYDLTGKGVAGSNQKVDLKLSAFTVQGIASVKFALLEIYTSLGYTTGKADVNLNGSYTVTYKDQSTIPASNYNVTVVDPIALSYNNSGVSNTWGVRLNLLFFKIFGDYTFANYNGFGAGVAFSFR